MQGESRGLMGNVRERGVSWIPQVSEGGKEVLQRVFETPLIVAGRGSIYPGRLETQ
jgi:hypothetical protein